ncbi:hypothetical protein TPB0596_42570 [Tsukamurella pulmonis]|uniref:hypothetical protein n=1 Tax=Tsukamurella pulmonis TaxID=47312 RepID=UPI001EE1185C|nr:hypothetical protein [Tsukamurella pulmonis]BDD84494.1 hypothetical protein TPB0596_42570 [Tsukamurella pulmonis]
MTISLVNDKEIDFADTPRDEAIEHLLTMWERSRGYAFVASKDPHTNQWEEASFPWPARRDDLFRWVTRRLNTKHVFYAPHVMGVDKRGRGNAKVRHWVWLDLDDAVGDDSFLTEFPPTLRVDSGTEGHGHLFWRVDDLPDWETHQRLCTAIGLTLQTKNDKVTDNDLFRLPGSINHKQGNDGARVRRASYDRATRYACEALSSAVRTQDVVIDTFDPVHVPSDQAPSQKPSAKLARMLADDDDADGYEAGEDRKRYKATWSTVAQCFEEDFSLPHTLYLMSDYIPGTTKFEHHAGGLRAKVAQFYNERESKSRKTAAAKDAIFATETLQFIHDECKRRMLSPMVGLADALVHAAMVTPPGWMMPPIVGKAAAMNLLLVLVGPSGAGKSSSDDPIVHFDPDRILRLGKRECELSRSLESIEVGSPQAIAAALMDSYPKPFGNEDSDNPDANLYYTWARVFKWDEIDGLRAQLDRGLDMSAELRKVWSGAALGTFTKATVNRIIAPAGQYRAVGVVNAPTDQAGALLKDAKGGLTQRLTLFDATDDDKQWSEDEPERQSRLLQLPREFMNADTSEGLFVVPASIRRQVRRDKYEGTYEDTLDAHRNLMRLKIAAYLAVLHGGVEVTEQFWQIAGAVCDASTELRDTVMRRMTALEKEQAAARGARAAITELTKQAELHTVRGRARERVLKVLDDFGPDVRSHVKRRLSPKQQPFFDELVKELIEEGFVKKEGAKVMLA